MNEASLLGKQPTRLKSLRKTIIVDTTVEERPFRAA